MTDLRWRFGIVMVCVVLLHALPARGHDDPLSYASFATIDIEPPLISGVLWLPFEAIDTMYRIDRDGDMKYTQAELQVIRSPLRRYLNQGLVMLWQGRIHRIETGDYTLTKRPGASQSFLKISFKVRDLPPGAPVEIVSKLLQDFSRSARCVALITRGGRREVFVLGPEDYYRSHRILPPEVPGSTYRPASQRGRIAVSGNTLLEMLYAVPEGSFYLYILKEDRETPLGLEAKPITALIRAGKHESGKRTPVILEPKPQSVDAAGRCSRFAGKAARFLEVGDETFSADMEVGSGSKRRRVIFDFPSVTVLSREEAAKAARHYACPKLCLGVESREASAKCMRCGSGLIEAFGAPVPGVGRVGRHGGDLRKLYPRPILAEALLTGSRQFRLYLTDENMKPRKVAKASAQAGVTSAGDRESVPFIVAMAPSKDGTFLFGEIPEGLLLPLEVGCEIDLGDGQPPLATAFHLHGVIDIVE